MSEKAGLSFLINGAVIVAISPVFAAMYAGKLFGFVGGADGAAGAILFFTGAGDSACSGFIHASNAASESFTVAPVPIRPQLSHQIVYFADPSGFASFAFFTS
jgi:hypothetical protein